MRAWTQRLAGFLIGFGAYMLWGLPGLLIVLGLFLLMASVDMRPKRDLSFLKEHGFKMTKSGAIVRERDQEEKA